MVSMILLVLAAAVSAHAQTAGKSKEPKVIDTLSEVYQKNLTNENFTINQPPVTSKSRKVKYIPAAFTFNSTETKPTSPGTNETPVLQPEPAVQLDAAGDSGVAPQANPGGDFKEKYKVLKSK